MNRRKLIQSMMKAGIEGSLLPSRLKAQTTDSKSSASFEKLVTPTDLMGAAALAGYFSERKVLSRL